MASCTEAFELQVKMELSDITMAKELVGKLAAYFAPSICFEINPSSAAMGDHKKSMQGSFNEVMGSLAPVWDDFKKTRVENRSIVANGDDTVVVTQVYWQHLTDANGAEIQGTSLQDFEVIQTVQCNSDGKICAWKQTYDASKVETARLAKQLAEMPSDDDGVKPLAAPDSAAAVPVAVEALPEAKAPPEGLSKMEQVKWRKEQKMKDARAGLQGAAASGDPQPQATPPAAPPA
eukprot:SAG11_NODE_1077_length_5964_cov_9.493265_1_plen_233_part_10